MKPGIRKIPLLLKKEMKEEKEVEELFYIIFLKT